MFMREREWPRVGELVVATVTRITNYGAYVYLEEYGKDGLLHISEVSSSWVRNIRDFVREGQKVVLKVLRVDPRKGHIDLSLRRVERPERERKLYEWKRMKRAEGLFMVASKELGISPEELYEKAGIPLEEEYGEIYAGLEEAARKGPKPLIKIGIPEKIAKTLAQIAQERIKIKKARIKGVLTLQCYQPDGVEHIKNALIEAINAGGKKAKVEAYTIGAPRYRIEVEAENYKDAEAVLSKAVKAAIDAIQSVGGVGAFQREK